MSQSGKGLGREVFRMRALPIVGVGSKAARRERLQLAVMDSYP